jgi:hypothetical protein
VRRVIVPLKFSDFSISPLPLDFSVVINLLNCLPVLRYSD